jgi:hypothetical protein
MRTLREVASAATPAAQRGSCGAAAGARAVQGACSAAAPGTGGQGSRKASYSAMAPI